MKKVVNKLELRNFASKSLIMSISVKNIKKVVIMVLTIVVIGMIVSSCTSGQRCAAYGERSRYQVDRH